MKYRLQHFTAYRYSHSVSQCHNEMRMVPRDNDRQKIISCEVSISPKPETYHERYDSFGNHAAYFNIRHSHSALTTHITTVLETRDSPSDFSAIQALSWEQAVTQMAFASSAPVADHAKAQQFTLPSPLVPFPSSRIQEFAQTVFTPGRSVMVSLTELMQKIHEEFTYQPGMTTINTPLLEAFDKKQGVCQDFAHIAIACVRAVGLPARYVSGYLETLAPAGQPKLIGADASHAWYSVFMPKLGWIDFDPTNNQRPDGRYVRVAYGRDYADVPPLNGVVFGGGKHTLEVRVDLRPLSEPEVDIFDRERQNR